MEISRDILELWERLSIKTKEGEELCDKLATEFLDFEKRTKYPVVDMSIDREDVDRLQTVKRVYEFEYDKYLKDKYNMEITSNYPYECYEGEKYVIQHTRCQGE